MNTVPKRSDKKVEVGTFNEDYSPEEKPVKPIYGYHLNTLRRLYKTVKKKAVVDTDNSDINGGHVVRKSSTVVKFD